MTVRRLSSVLLLVCCTLPLRVVGFPRDAAHEEQTITPPTIVTHVPPVYPDEARKARIQGVVVIEATVGADGVVRDPQVVESIPQLDEAALHAVRQWRYKPPLVDGVPTALIMTVKVNFSLSDKTATTAAPVASPNPAPPPPRSGPRASAEAEREWDRIFASATELYASNKAAQAVGIVEKFLSRYPDVARAHSLLGLLYEQLAGAGTPPTAQQRRQLETAARHLVRAHELHTEADERLALTMRLSTLYSPHLLDVPSEVERYTRRLVDEHPTFAESHMALARLLHARGDVAAAFDVLQKGRATSALPSPGLLMLMQYATEQVQGSRGLSSRAIQALLDEAIRAADSILARPTDDESDRRLAMMGKALALELQAEREPDRTRRIQLLVESERWGDMGIKGGGPLPPRNLSAAEATELEWRYVQGWYGRLADAGRFDEAIAAFEEYARTAPQIEFANTVVADVALRGARESRDAKQRLAFYEKAAVHLHQAIDRVKHEGEREFASRQLLEVYGPSALNRPEQEERTARAMIARSPATSIGYYHLAKVLLRSGRADEASRMLQAARRPGPLPLASLVRMTEELVGIIKEPSGLTDDMARRLAVEADGLVSEAEKIDAADVGVLVARAAWLNANADRLEKDQKRAAEQRERAKRLLQRAQERLEQKPK